MTLGFFVKDNGEIIPVNVSPGQRIRLSELQTAAPVPPSFDDLMSMSMVQLKAMTDSIGIHVTNMFRGPKHQVVQVILNKWNVVERATDRVVRIESRAIALASSDVPVGEVVGQETEETEDSSAYNPYRTKDGEEILHYSDGVNEVSEEVGQVEISAKNTSQEIQQGDSDEEGISKYIDNIFVAGQASEIPVPTTEEDDESEDDTQAVFDHLNYLAHGQVGGAPKVIKSTTKQAKHDKLITKTTEKRVLIQKLLNDTPHEINILPIAQSLSRNIHQFSQWMETSSEYALLQQVKWLKTYKPAVFDDIYKYLQETGSNTPSIKLDYIALSFFDGDDIETLREGLLQVQSVCKNTINLAFEQAVIENMQKQVQNRNAKFDMSSFEKMFKYATTETPSSSSNAAPAPVVDDTMNTANDAINRIDN